MFVKAVYKGQKRKFKLSDDSKYADLVRELVRCFGDQIKGLDIGYFDDDKEFIRISTDDDWEVCYEEAKIKNKDKTVNTVDIIVSEGNGVVPIQESQAVALDQSMQSFAAVSYPPPQVATSGIENSWAMAEKPPSTQESPKPNSSPMREEKPVPSIFEEEQVIDSKRFDGMSQESLPNKPASNDAVEENPLAKRGQPPVEDSFLCNSMMNSKLSVDIKDEIASMIDEKISKLAALNNTANFSKKPAAQTSLDQPKKFISCGNYDHGNVFCDVCKSRISQGARYKSIFTKDYDLCETCEANSGQQEPLIKIRKPISRNISEKLMQNFEFLKSIFNADEEEPKPVQTPSQKNLCHIRTSEVAQPPQTVTPTPQTFALPKQPSPQPQINICKKPIDAMSMIREAENALKKVSFALTPGNSQKPAAMTPLMEENSRKISRIFPRVPEEEIRKFLGQFPNKAFEDLINDFLDKVAPKYN